MLRDTLLYLSNQPRVFKFVRNSRLAKHFAKRFVAGETLADALDAVRALNARGISASLDLLGESTNNEREARAARDEYLSMLDRIHEARLDANVSVKLTAMGLDIDEELCVAVVQDILARAQQYDSFVRIDMESSDVHGAHAQDVRGAALSGLQGQRRHRAAELSATAPSPTSST